MGIGHRVPKWHTTGWKELMGRDPTDDDLVMPSRRGNARGVHAGNRYLREDSVRLSMRPRHQHCTRHTLISLAQDDGAEGSVLRWITHAPPRSAFDGYTRQQWGRLCAELGKLNIALREITEPSAPPPKASQPWLNAQRRRGFATGSATEAKPSSQNPLQQGESVRKHRGIEPPVRRVNADTTGFEDQARHQTGQCFRRRVYHPLGHEAQRALGPGWSAG